MIKNLLVLFLLFFATVSNASNRTNFRVTRITTRHGLPGNTIRAMVQDTYGFLWFGGSDGLARYDGYNLIDFNDLTLGKKSKNIGLLYIDNVNQLLWLSTSTYSYSCYDLKTGKFLKFTGGKDQPYSKRFHSSTGEWMWDKLLGVRHAVYENSKIVLHDYTKENGKLTSNYVTRMTEDRYGNIWVSTRKGLTRIRGNKSMTVLKDKNLEDCMSTDKYIVAFCKDNQTFYVVDFKGKVIFSRRITNPDMRVGRLSNALYWQKRCLYFTNRGTVVFDPRTGIISRPQELQLKSGTVQGDTKGYKMVANQQGELLILPPYGSSKKLLLNKGLKTTNEKKKIFSFAVGKNHLLYIASYGMGLFIYNLLTGQLEQYTAQDSEPVIYSNYIHDILVDRLGDIWLSTEAAGLIHLHTIDDYSAQYFYVDNKIRGDWTNNVRLIFVDKHGEIIAATKDNNMYQFSSVDGTFKFMRETKAGISDYMIDHAGHEWICTRGDGLYVDGVHYGKGIPGHELPVNDLYNALEDKYGRVWIATWGGGLLMTELIHGHLKLVKQYLTEQYNAQRVRDLELSPDGLLFVGSYNGLYVLDTKKKLPSQKDFVVYNSISQNFPGDEVLCLKYAYGSLWAGIMSVGVVKCDFSKGISRMKYRVIDKYNGLADNGVRTISSDSYGAVWVGTSSSLSRIDCRDNVVRNFYVSQNPLSNAFTVNGSMEMKDGRLFFGTQEGLLVVHPKKLGSMKPYVKKVSLTDLQINGLSIYNQSDVDFMSQAIQLTKKITLDHSQNSLRINFSTLDFNGEDAQLFQTKLDGVEDSWRPATNSNFAIYTHLAPGLYKFHVRAWNGVEWGPDTILTIRISQPWWNTWWAWSIYLLLAGLLILYIYENTRARLRLHQEMKINKQVTEFRLNFFTHVTHEFRTPLAIIQSGVSNLVDSKTQKVSKSSVQTVKRGTKRLLRLVNQLMEFRRISTNNRKLHVAEGDIVVFVRDIWQDLWSIANQKDLGYHFIPFEHHYQMLFDHEIVEAVVYNLLSNALKYTGKGGNVTMKIAFEEGNEDQLVFTVEDDGPGVSPEHLDQLFQPFMHGYASKGGMGIGLYTARKMAETHHGSLIYERVSDKGGSRFIFTLPNDPGVYSEDEICQDVAISVDESA
ncbi:MAG: two-component regulator propeller domain-containing protein, partial [Prevotella sp.]